MDEKTLKEIGARATAAAPGPWKHDGGIIVDPNRKNVAGYFTQPGFVQTMDFIAHAREDVPALVAEVRRLRESPPIPERVLYEMRMIYLHLTSNLGGDPNAEGVERARARVHALIMEFGGGEFFT
jgi:hypothetical protein